MRVTTVFVALFVLLATPVAAQDAPCYVCAHDDDNGTRCHRLAIPDFSQSRCGLRCFFYLTHVCFCRTHGGSCALNNPLDGGESGARFTVSPWALDTIEREAGEVVRGFLDWSIPKSLKGDGPHEIRGQVSVDKVTYDFVGEVSFHFGIANIHYKLEDHPDIDYIMADVGPLGSGGGVLVARHDGTEKKINLNSRIDLDDTKAYGLTP